MEAVDILEGDDKFKALNVRMEILAHQIFTKIRLKEISLRNELAICSQRCTAETAWIRMFERLKAQFKKRAEGKVHDSKVGEKQAEDTRKNSVEVQE